MLRFNPATGLSVEPTEDIREAVRADWRAALGEMLDVDPSTPAGQLIDSETAIIAQKDSDVLFMANQFNPLTAEGVWQDALGKIYFLTRQVAEPSVVTCACTGLAGTVIAAGSLVKGTDGAIFKSLASAIIPGGGSVNIVFAAEEPGPMAVAANTVTRIVTVTPGWDTVNNPAAGSPGRNAETRAEFEQRRYASVAKNAHGTVAALYGALADIAGVLDVFIAENTGGSATTIWGVSVPGHSVYISIYGGADADIAEVIYAKKDAGCGTAGNTPLTYVAADAGGATYVYNVQRPEPLALAVQVTMRLTASTPSTIVDDVTAAVLANFGGADGTTRVKIASVLYASRFYAPVVNAGVQDLLSVKVSTVGGEWDDTVTIDADQVPVLSASDISVDIQQGS